MNMIGIDVMVGLDYGALVANALKGMGGGISSPGGDAQVQAAAQAVLQAQAQAAAVDNTWKYVAGGFGGAVALAILVAIFKRPQVLPARVLPVAETPA